MVQENIESLNYMVLLIVMFVNICGCHMVEGLHYDAWRLWKRATMSMMLGLLVAMRAQRRRGYGRVRLQ